jgi:hypothetical protein
MPAEGDMAGPRVFAYIIATVGPNYKLRGSVPRVKEGKVFFGPCKKRMRPEVKKGDYIMGISPAGVGEQRRVLLWMCAEEPMTFAEAYERGEKNRLFRLARRNAIHVRPKRGIEQVGGDPEAYEHIPRATHSTDWWTDIDGKRDAFLVGKRGSWAAGPGGPVVTEELVELLREGITWRGHATLQNPLTENPRGKHALLIGNAARKVIQWVPEPTNRLLSSSSRTTCCHRKCSCE